MANGELLGVSIEVAAPAFEVSDPLVDAWFPGHTARLVADRDRAILSVAEVGTFAIDDGLRIRLDPHVDASPDAISAWLHGTVAALLLAQRRRFALHASAVGIDGVAVAIAGERGMGKTTAALRLAQRGHTLLTDDVSPLDSEVPVTVRPFARPLHVWPEAAASLGLDLSGARPIVPEQPKLAVGVELRAPAPVAAIVVLQTSDAASGVEVIPCRGVSAHISVSRNTYRTGLLGGLYPAEMFAWAASIAANVPVRVVTRSREGWTVDAVARAVEEIAGA